MLGASARLSIGLAVGLVAITGEASAQDRMLKVGIRAQVEHDSNVVLGGNALGQRQNLTPEDVLFIPSATIDLLQPLGRHSAYLRGSAGYTFYDKNTDLNRERIDVASGLNVALRSCGLTADVTYGRGINRIDDPTFIYDARNIRETIGVTGGLSCSSATGFGVMAQVARNWSDNSRQTLQEANYESSTYTAGLTYARPALGTLTLFGSRETVDYPDRVVTDGYTVDSVGMTYDRQLGARIQGTVTASYAQVEQDGRLLPGLGLPAAKQDVTSYGAKLSFRVNSRLNLLGSFNRGVSPAIGFLQAYEVSNRYRISGTYQIGSRLTATAGFNRVERDPSENALPSLVVPTESTLDVASASLRYQQSDRLGFELYLEHEKRDTNLDPFDYTSDRIGLTTIVTF